jgi:ParB family chromosome partitioning protein
VRREWLAGFVTRKTAPKGAEALICEAVVGGHYTLSKAMDHRHPMIFRLLDVERPGTHGGLIQACDTLAARATTPKASTMVTLAVVVAAWEDATGRHSWRNPTAWDARVLGALVEWGYEPSEVERIVLGEEPASVQADTTDDTTDEAGDSAA